MHDKPQIVNTLVELSDQDFSEVVKSAVYKRDAKTAAMTVFECVNDLVNGNSRDALEGWWKVWTETHPTLRQCVFRLFAALCNKWVTTFEAGGWSPDARDKASFEEAQRLKDVHFPFI